MGLNSLVMANSVSSTFRPDLSCYMSRQRRRAAGGLSSRSRGLRSLKRCKIEDREKHDCSPQRDCGYDQHYLQVTSDTDSHSFPFFEFYKCLWGFLCMTRAPLFPAATKSSHNNIKQFITLYEQTCGCIPPVTLRIVIIDPIICMISFIQWHTRIHTRIHDIRV